MVDKQAGTKRFLDLVQHKLPLVESWMRFSDNGHNLELETAIDHLLSAGGKRIRPTISLLIGDMLSAEDQKLVILSAAVEMLHSATLVHDDFIDDAFQRREISTLNTHWSPAAVVLTGDFMFARAARLAADTDNVEIIQDFADTLATIVNGEINQMFPGDHHLDLPNYEQRIYAKTASLFELASKSAAILSPVDRGTINKAGRFGYLLGMAFQIMDDVMDFTSQQSAVGKPVANDLRRGIITLPVIYYFDQYPGDPDLDYLLSNDHYDQKIIQGLVDSICSSRAIKKSIHKAEEFIDQALEILNSMPECDQREGLEQLSMYIVSRKI